MALFSYFVVLCYYILFVLLFPNQFLIHWDSFNFYLIFYFLVIWMPFYMCLSFNGYMCMCVCVCVCVCVSSSTVSDSLQPHGLQPARLFCSWNSPGKNTGVGCCALLQGILSRTLFNKSQWMVFAIHYWPIHSTSTYYSPWLLMIIHWRWWTDSSD